MSNLNLFSHELVVDNFAGGGGASEGIEQALGRSVDLATSLARRDLLKKAEAFEFALELVEGQQAKSVLKRLAFCKRKELEAQQ